MVKTRDRWRILVKTLRFWLWGLVSGLVAIKVRAGFEEVRGEEGRWWVGERKVYPLMIESAWYLKFA